MKLRGLYAILDVETLDARRIHPIEFARALLGARPAALQVRSKVAPVYQTLGLLRELQPLCRQAGVPLVANDRADLAVWASCDMVHVGQTDENIEQVRRRFPGLAIGLSTHTLAELDSALVTRPAYVAFGPVFSTRTKVGAAPTVGLHDLVAAYARAKSAGIPLVAIGGITASRAPNLLGAADALAVISDLLPRAKDMGPRAEGWQRSVSARARFYRDLIASGPSATVIPSHAS